MDTVLLSVLTLAAVIAAISSAKLIGFLEDIHIVEKFQSVFILSRSNDSFFADENVCTSLDIPVILATETSRTLFLKRKFSNNLLVIVYFHSSISDEATLQRLVKNLRQMRSCKTIFLLSHPSMEESILRKLFNFCWAHDMINVLAIFGDFSNTSTYYRYTNMPSFVIEENHWIEGESMDDYFPDRMLDLKGHQLPVVFGGSNPKMIFSQNKHGETIIAGYAGHVIQALAKKHNASLKNAKINKVLSADRLVDLVLNKSVDISAATTYINPSLDWYTYPYEKINWCLMLPIETNIPIYKIFTIVFQLDTLLITIGFIVILSVLLESATYLAGRKITLLNYFLNENCLRGALGQSFIEIPNASFNIKLIYLLICLIGILLVTSYNAFLGTYMTGPPSEKKIETFDDLLASGIKIYSLTQEYHTLMRVAPLFKNKYSKMFLFEDDFASYLKFRDSWNTTYSYMVNNAKWIIMQEQQQFFSRPLFRLPKGMCFLRGVPMAFPINENTIYKDILNFLILEIHSAGLLDYWQKRALYELIETGKLKMADFATKPEFVALHVKDLQLIWMGMGIAFSLAIMCFAGEICISKWKARSLK